MDKWTKLGKSVIEKYKSVMSLPKNQKKNFFATEICLKIFEILVDFVFFPIRKISSVLDPADWKLGMWKLSDRLIFFF